MQIMALSTIYTGRQNLDKEIRKKVIGKFGDDLVFATTIPRAVPVGEATATLQSVVEPSPESPATFAFHKLAKEIREALHLHEIRSAKLELIEKTRAAIQDRLVKEIYYWDGRAQELKLNEQVGKPNARLNSQEALKRADELNGRLTRRLLELDRESEVVAAPPVITGGPPSYRSDC
jgi:hypothetical protein